MKNFLLALVTAITLTPSAPAAEDAIKLVLEGVLDKQHDGVLQSSERFCTAVSQYDILKEEKTITFSYVFSASDGTPTVYTIGYYDNQPNWKNDSTKRLISVPVHGLPYSESLEIKYNEEFQVTAVRMITQNEWCVLN